MQQQDVKIMPGDATVPKGTDNSRQHGTQELPTFGLRGAWTLDRLSLP